MTLTPLILQWWKLSMSVRRHSHLDLIRQGRIVQQFEEGVGIKGRGIMSGTLLLMESGLALRIHEGCSLASAVCSQLSTVDLEQPFSFKIKELGAK